MSDYGELIDASTVRFERLLPGPIDRIWAYLVDPDKRALWLCGGNTELKIGGHVDLLFNNSTLSDQPDIPPPEKYKTMDKEVSFHGTVTQCDPPRLLAHTWDFEDQQSEVRYELAEQGDKVVLVIVHSRLNSNEEAVSACGGWHTHLGILEDVLHGVDRRAFWITHVAIEAEYEKRVSA